jgi:two-component system, OmpR family, KDP operon response regulator KdpE
MATRGGLGSQQRQARSQRQLLHEVWGSEYSDETGNLREYIARLRRKLEPEHSRPRYFTTEAGLGYRFDAAE